MPELCFSEVNTSQYIRAQLDVMDIPYEYPIGVTGIRAGPIGSSDPAAPTIALRADMDALPITEEVDVPYKSTTPGRMHACGHDAHVAMLLGAARLLKSRESSLAGRVVLLFQPAEEAKGGARELIRGGALQGVGAIHGLHVWPALPAGTVGTRGGVLMAASDRFSFTVRGAGGHGAMPHTTRDPVVAAAAVVIALQSLVSRETSPVDSAVVTVARFNTGPGASNVIPDSVELSGTVRALTPDTFARLHRRLEQTAVGVAAGHGCTVEDLAWSEVPYPPTKNDEQLSSLVREVASGLLGPSAVQLVEPSMAAEDFSFYGEVVPQASFTFLGIGDAAKGTDVGLHSPRFQMDEQQMPLGAALHAAVATEWLSRQSAQQQGEQQQGEQRGEQEAAAEVPAAEEPAAEEPAAEEPQVEEQAAEEQAAEEPQAEEPAAEEPAAEEPQAANAEPAEVAAAAAAAPSKGEEGEEEEGEDPRLAGLRAYARERGVKGMPSWVRRMLADDPEFRQAIAQADFEEDVMNRLKVMREQLEQKKRERQAAKAAAAAEEEAAAAEAEAPKQEAASVEAEVVEQGEQAAHDELSRGRDCGLGGLC